MTLFKQKVLNSKSSYKLILTKKTHNTLLNISLECNKICIFTTPNRHTLLYIFTLMVSVNKAVE